jgi:hypothetical protein
MDGRGARGDRGKLAGQQQQPSHTGHTTSRKAREMWAIHLTQAQQLP